MSELNANGAGNNQAVQSPGGKVSVPRDARDKLFANSIRLSLGHLKRDKQRTDLKEIYVAMCEKFGDSSPEVKGITGIAPNVDLTWIIAYGKITNGFVSKVPKGMVSKVIKLNKCDIMIEDAMVEASVYVSARKEEARLAQVKAIRDMTFRIQGLPLDVNQKELFKVLKDLGFDIDDMDKIKQMYDNFDGQLVRNGIVMFRVSCNDEGRGENAKLMGEHSIQLDDVIWKIKINCFGFCIGCKKEGHKINECKELPVVIKTCFFCKKNGHVKKDCPAFLDKKANTTCYKCRLKGHYSNDCTNSPMKWNMDLESFPDLVVDAAKTKLNYTVETNEPNEIEKEKVPGIDGLAGLFDEPDALAVTSASATESNNKRMNSSPLSNSMEHKKQNFHNDDSMSVDGSMNENGHMGDRLDDDHAKK